MGIHVHSYNCPHAPWQPVETARNAIKSQVLTNIPNVIVMFLPLEKIVEQYSIHHHVYLPQKVAAVRCYLIQTQLAGLIQLWHLWQHISVECSV